MTRYSIAEIADALEAEAVGDVDLTIVRAAEPATAGPDDLALATDPKFAEGLSQGAARAALLWQDADWQGFGLQAAIRIRRPRYAMSGLTRLLDRGPDIAPGIHPTAVIHETATIGAGAAISAFVMIGREVVLGANARIGSHVSIGHRTRIGADALIYPGVHLGYDLVIGDRFVASSGTVIGSDGFSFVTPEKSGAESVRETLGDAGDAKAQSWTRIHSLGGVEIGDDVEIGANCAIDRGTIRATRIGSGTKLDNHVHLAHNCEIGRDCILAGQTGVAGSAKIGNNVVLGGRTGVVDHISVGDGVITGGGTIIMSNAPAGRVMLGYPAVRMEAHIESYKALRRLPRLFKQVADLQKAVSMPDQSD